jgi:hypothetical protein
VSNSHKRGQQSHENGSNGDFMGFNGDLYYEQSSMMFHDYPPEIRLARTFPVTQSLFVKAQVTGARSS